MFGFLKNKLKEWAGKAKDKLSPEEAEIEEKPEKEEGEKEKEIKVETKKEEKVLEEIPKLKPEEDGTAIEIETELEEGVPQEIIEEELKEEIEKKHEKKGFISKIFRKKQEEEEKLEEKEIKAEPKEEKSEESFLKRVKFRFSYKISEEDFNSLFEDLEMLLLENNVAFEVVEDIKKILSNKLIGREISRDKLETEIKKELKNALNELIIDPTDPLSLISLKKEKPFVILFFGINGTGKTTSIAKLAYLLKSKGFSIVLAAGDTFRAASIEQISEHADKLGVTLIKHDYKADPSAVGFDAIKYAKSHRIDVVLIDTAGRMHTKANLLAEMEKICRVTQPDLKIFVAESIAGNDATEQAKTFNDAIEIDGSILSKADVDEKGGTIISVSHATHRPVFYLGTGQKYEDLKLFNKEEFIRSLGL